MPADLPAALPLATAVLAFATVGYAVAMIWFTLGIRTVKGGSDCCLRVTVVVAVRNEVESVSACLDDLLSQDYPPELLEVIVVDDGSNDGTGTLVSDRAGRDHRLKLLSTGGEHGSEASGWMSAKKAAITLGVEAAEGEIILTTDADCRLPAGWVRGMQACFLDDVGLVAGFSAVADCNHLRGGLEGLDFLILMGCAAGSIGNGHPMGASSQSLGYRKAAFAEVGGYDAVRERVSGDDVLLVQLIRRLTSWQVVFVTAPDTFVSHPVSTSWKQLLGQRQRWASNAPYQRLLDPVFFAYLTATFTLGLLLSAAPALLWLGVLSPWVVAGSVLVKVVVELTLLVRGMGLFGRWQLLRYYPAWTVLQPFYTVLIGIMGTFGRVAWKGVVHERGGGSRFQEQTVANAARGDG